MSTINNADLAEILEKPYDERTMEEVQQLLQADTPPALIEWKGQNVLKQGNGFTALALAHVDARFMQNRLDEVLGMFRWQSEVRFEGSLLMIGLGVVSPDSGEWVWKWDTGQESPKELVDKTGFGGAKGVYSTSFKRACYQWGIARDLYALPKPRVRCNAKKGGSGKLQFTGWIDHPTGTTAESEETGRAHATQVDDVHDYMPANANTFYTIAYSRLKYDRDAAVQILGDFTDKGTGEIDYTNAILALEKNLPAENRAFTKQEMAALGKQG